MAEVTTTTSPAVMPGSWLSFLLCLVPIPRQVPKQLLIPRPTQHTRAIQGIVTDDVGEGGRCLVGRIWPMASPIALARACGRCPVCRSAVPIMPPVRAAFFVVPHDLRLSRRLHRLLHQQRSERYALINAIEGALIDASFQ